MKVPFTLAWYKEQKDLDRSDKSIAEQFYVSQGTISYWKMKIGWKAGDGMKYCGPKVKIDLDKLISLYDEGVSCRSIADHLNVTDTTVHYHLKKLGRKGG